MMLQANARSINVKRTDLLEKLKTNRDLHAAQFKIAMEGYRMEVEKILHNAWTEFTKNEKTFDDGLQLLESPPEDHTSDYDLIIGMMEMSLDEVINLDSQSFNQYVMDNWSWKQSFTSSTVKYMTNVAAAGR